MLFILPFTRFYTQSASMFNVCMTINLIVCWLIDNRALNVIKFILKIKELLNRSFSSSKHRNIYTGTCWMASEIRWIFAIERSNTLIIGNDQRKVCIFILIISVLVWVVLERRSSSLNRIRPRLLTQKINTFYMLSLSYHAWRTGISL